MYTRVMDDILDPYDERHYKSIDSFAALLRKLDYGVEIIEGNKLTVRLPLGIHPYWVYNLASYVNEAMIHGVIIAEVFNQDDEDLFELELIANIPLFKRVELPVDYFRLAEGIERIGLRFDTDAAEGIELITLLMSNSYVYVDVDGQEGPIEALLEWLEELFPDDFAVLEVATDERYADLLTKHWLDYFDREFDTAQNLAEDHLIVYCLGLHDQGYGVNEMYFLIDRQDFEALEVPKHFYVGDN